MDNEVNLVCVGTTSHPDTHCGIGSGRINNVNNHLLSKSQLKMREQALRKRVSANTSVEPSYKAPIFGIPVKIEPSDSDRTQKLIKQALGDYDDFKPVIEKMFICPNPQGTPAGNAPISAVPRQLTVTAPAHHHHAAGKRKRSHSLEEVDISQLIKESFALPPLLSRILNTEIVVKQENHDSIVNSFHNSSSVLIKTEPDQNSIPNCDKSLPSSRKHPESVVSLPQSSKVASKTAPIESTQLPPPPVLENFKVKKEERGSLSPDTSHSSANNWSLSCFLDSAAPECQQQRRASPAPPSSTDKKVMNNREDQPQHKLLMADIDSSFSLAVAAEPSHGTNTGGSAKKKQRKNFANLAEFEPKQHEPPAPVASTNHNSKSPASARLPKTYRLLARKKTPPTTPPPTAALGNLEVKPECKTESMTEKLRFPPSSEQSVNINDQGNTPAAGVSIAQTSHSTSRRLLGGPEEIKEVKREFGTTQSPTDPGHSSCGASGSDSEYSDYAGATPQLLDHNANAAADANNNNEVIPERQITSLPVKIDLALIKKIPILPYHYNNDINYATGNNNNTSNSLDASALEGGGIMGSVSASFASSNTANAWAPLVPPPHNPLTRWDLDGRQMPLPPSSIDIGDPVERLPAQLSRFELFSPYQYKPPTLSACGINNGNKQQQQLKPNEPQPQHQAQAIFPPKISWGLPSQLPCVYSPTRRFDIPFWRNIGLCPELTTYPCNDIIRIAKNLKRSADREVTRNLKIMMYLDAVLYFFLNGDYMQNKKFDLTGAHKIYHDTLQVCRHISDLVQKGINNNVSDNTVMDQIFVILTQKIQALLYVKMFQCKKEQCLRNQRVLNQEFPKLFGPPPAAFSLGINSGHNYSYTQDGATSLLNHASSPDPSPVSSVGSTTNYTDSGVKTNVPDPDPKSTNRIIHPTVHQQLTMLEGALISHHLWDLSENGISILSSPNEISTSNYPRHLISSNPHADYRECFTEILTVCRQPLTLNSSVWHLVIYVKFALYYLGYWLNPTYYDPQTTIPSLNTSGPPAPSELKDFHKKNRSSHKEMAIGGK